MPLNLAHKNLDVYQVSQDILVECYLLVKSFPKDERYNLAAQIKSAALSVNLNLAEGCSRRSASERRRFFEISRGSIIELDAALVLAVKLGLITFDTMLQLDQLISRCFSMLSKLIGKSV